MKKRRTEDLQNLVTILSNLEETRDDEEIGKEYMTQLKSVKSFRMASIQTEENESNTAVATQTERKVDNNEDTVNISPLVPTAEDIRNSIVEGMDMGQVKQLIDVSWPKSVYINTNLCKGSILAQVVDDSRVVQANEERFSESLLCKNLCAQVPGLKGKTTTPSGGLIVVESKDAVLSEDGEEEISHLLVIVR